MTEAEILMLKDAGKKLKGFVFDDVSRKQAADIIAEIVFISETARTKGILALEPVAKSLEGDKRPGFGILYDLAILMVDGTDPVLVDELFTTGYWMNQHEGFECLTSLLVRKGILAIQAKENPYIIAEKLKAHLPYSEKSDTGETVMAYVNKALSQPRMTANSLVK